MIDRFFTYFTHTRNGGVFVLAILCAAFSIVGGGVAVLKASGNPVIEPIRVSIVEKTTRMETGGFAVGEVNGEQVLVRGDWAVGDVVSAYPNTVEGGTKPQYDVANPNAAKFGYVVIGLLIGMVVGVVLTLFLIIASGMWEKRKVRRERESREIVNAAIGAYDDDPFRY